MNKKDFDKLVESMKEGGILLSRVSSKRLDELIAIHEFLVQKTLPLCDGDPEINKEYVDVLVSLKELKLIRGNLDST